jgi:pseudaminic acid synthase
MSHGVEFAVGTIAINGRLIGPGQPAYIIAEMSGNHNQSFDNAVKIIQEAKRAGADAVKLQTYTADTLTFDGSHECFRVVEGTLWSGQTLHQLYQEAYTPWEWQPKLKRVADDLGIHCFSSPFDPTAVEFLERCNVPAYKVASFELVDLPLIRLMAKTGKPLIMSTGMATLAEIDDAVRAARDAGCRQLALLKCTTAYPAPPEEANLRTLPHMAAAFSTPVGISDHTLGIAVPVAAVAVGASIVEKHFTLARSDGGPDSEFSLEPAEFRAMVEEIRIAERALGEVRYEPSPGEAAGRMYRRSLFAVKDIAQGQLFTGENVRSIRPGNGLPPKYLEEVLGRPASRNISAGTPLTRDLIA